MQNNPSRFRRQSNSNRTLVQICGRLCKIPRQAVEALNLPAYIPGLPLCGSFASSASQRYPLPASLAANRLSQTFSIGVQHAHHDDPSNARSGLDTVDELGAAQTPPESQCCFAAPPVLVFDAQGNLLQSWGSPGEGFDWPKREHGIYVDKDDSVWISGAGPGDRQILKFKSDGHFLMQIGHPSTDPANSTRTDILGLPAGMEVDRGAHEIYIADGYLNKRVIVFDSDKGTFKRLWGAYGNPPNDADPGAYNPAQPPDQQFRNPVHCVHLSRDGLVYVCDRMNDRLQVIHPIANVDQAIPRKMDAMNRIAELLVRRLRRIISARVRIVRRIAVCTPQAFERALV